MTVSNSWLAGVSLLQPAKGWTDRSLLAYAAPQQEGGIPANVTLSRDERRSAADPPAESFEDYAIRQGQVLAANLPGFQARLPTPLDGGTPGVADSLFSWRSGAVSLTQWVVWIALKDGSVLTYTATADSSQFERNRPLFDTTLRSIHIEPTAFMPPA